MSVLLGQLIFIIRLHFLNEIDSIFSHNSNEPIQAPPDFLEQYYPLIYQDNLESKRLGMSFQVRGNTFSLFTFRN